jgi:hypothetical protein
MVTRTRRLLGAGAAIVAGGLVHALSTDPLLAGGAGVIWGIVGYAAAEHADLWYGFDHGPSKWAAAPALIAVAAMSGTNGIPLSIRSRLALAVHLLGVVLAAMHVGYALAREGGRRNEDGTPAATD